VRGCKTLSRTRRTARPYAPVAMVFLFTSIIEFTVPRTTSFTSHLPKKGLGGSSYRISSEEKLSGRLNQSNGSDRCRETETKNGNAYAGYTDLVANVGPEPRTNIFGKSFPSLTPPR